MRISVSGYAVVVGAVALAGAGRLYAQADEAAPAANVAVARACEAAGGLEMFRRLGTVRLDITQREVTTDGQPSEGQKAIIVTTPGPVPGRLEVAGQQLTAADDGSGGWATQGGKPDARPSTKLMVKRVLTSDLFPLLLPFSLTWEGVTVAAVTPATLKGKPVWRLSVQISRSFFHTAQIATNWTVDLDRESYSVVRAESPYVDSGHGIVADGMRFTWGSPLRLKGVWLHGDQKLVGIDELGREKVHNRIDAIRYRLLGDTEAARLFANPIPEEQRPQAPVGPVVTPAGAKK